MDIAEEDDLYIELMHHNRGENIAKVQEVTMELCGKLHKLEINTGGTRTVLNE